VELVLSKVDGPTDPHWMRMDHRGDGYCTSRQHAGTGSTGGGKVGTAEEAAGGVIGAA
jgi:hypothetical protein